MIEFQIWICAGDFVLFFYYFILQLSSNDDVNDNDFGKQIRFKISVGPNAIRRDHLNGISSACWETMANVFFPTNSLPPPWNVNVLLQNHVQKTERSSECVSGDVDIQIRCRYADMKQNKSIEFWLLFTKYLSHRLNWTRLVSLEPTAQPTKNPFTAKTETFSNAFGYYYNFLSARIKTEQQPKKWSERVGCVNVRWEIANRDEYCV